MEGVTNIDNLVSNSESSCESSCSDAELEFDSTKLPVENNTQSCSSKDIGDVYDETDSSTCSSCSTRRNSESDFEIAFSSLFRTPSSTTTSHSSNLGSPVSRQGTQTLLDGIDVLLQRITSERFAELRNIQLSERPVSGGQARDNIETFFRRAVHGPTEEERIIIDENNRPAEVVQDVQLLQQRSVVQSSLQTQFRGILERALLQRISGQQAQQANPTPINPPRVRRNLVGGSDFRARLESLYGGRSSSTAAPVASQRRAPVAQQNRHPTLAAPPTPPPQASSQIAPTQSNRNIPPAPAPPVDNRLASNETQNNEGISIESSLRLLAENITDDLNTLESLQVVSNMLDGGFRNELEDLMMNRIQDENVGLRTLQLIRSLPGRRPQNTHHNHNRMFTTSSLPGSQSVINHGVSQELDLMRTQMDEMKRMLAMSMEIQMDTQRAIRQEVSAIFSTFMQDFLAPRAAASSAPTPPPTMSYPPVTTPVSSGQCVICIDRNVDTVLYQCGHMCVCHHCGLQLKMDGHNCPMCRAPIKDVIRAYQTQ